MSNVQILISGVLVSFMGGMTPNHLRPPEKVCVSECKIDARVCVSVREKEREREREKERER